MNSAGNGRQPVFYSIINNDYYNKESFIKKDMDFVQSTRVLHQVGHGIIIISFELHNCRPTH
jgi:hypothetical protein